MSRAPLPPPPGVNPLLSRVVEELARIAAREDFAKGEERMVISDDMARWLWSEARSIWRDRVQELWLAGSRAKGTQTSGSDWDVFAVVSGMKPLDETFGPLIHHKAKAPDGNPLEMLCINPADWSMTMHRAIADLVAYGIEIRRPE